MTSCDTHSSAFLESRSAAPYLILAAHPDDEVIGLASFLPGWSERAVVVYATDGAPQDLRYAQSAGYNSVEAYAAARRMEARSALSLVPIPAASLFWLELTDQEVTYNLVELVDRIGKLIDQVKPEIVFTHPYEGGHPDHDALSFAASAAVKISRNSPRRFEFCSYHAGQTGLVTGDFLPDPGRPVCTKQLSRAERHLKRKMFKAYKSQRAVLKLFDTGIEKIRAAPEYQYSRAPHPGRLNYEGQVSSLTGPQWRSLAASAAGKLGMRPILCPESGLSARAGQPG